MAILSFTGFTSVNIRTRPIEFYIFYPFSIAGDGNGFFCRSWAMDLHGLVMLFLKRTNLLPLNILFGASSPILSYSLKFSSEENLSTPVKING